MSRSSIAAVLAIYCSASVVVHSARILAFLPIAFKSHHNVYQPILHELARRGHEIVYFSPYDMNQRHPNISLIQSIDTLPLVVENFGEGIFGKLSVVESARSVGEISLFTTEKILSLLVSNQLIHSSERFDLILHESFFGQDFSCAFQHKFNAPGVMLVPCADSAWANEISGLTDNPSYISDYRAPYTDRMTFAQRLYSAYVQVVTVGMNYYYQGKTQSLVDKYFNYTGWESRPSISSLVFDQALILINSHHSLSYPFPKSPHVKQIGGVNIVESQPLPQRFEKFINTAEHGVIYFSFGSVVNSNMAGAIRDVFSSTFSKINQKVLWKWDGEPWAHVPDNVMLSKWFPQQDILAHENVKLFITHGGLLSLFEAVHHAVPVVVVPFFGDQERNAQFVVSSGLGQYLDLTNVTAKSISWALNEVLNNNKYKKEAIKRSNMMKERTMRPTEEAAYWIEYVLKYGKALQPASVHLPFLQYHLIDIWILIAAACAAVLYFFTFITRILVRVTCDWLPSCPNMNFLGEKRRKID